MNFIFKITKNLVLTKLLKLVFITLQSFQAITVPSMAVSHIMLESYKKYILVTLMVNGKIPTLPKYTSHVIGKYIKVMRLMPLSKMCIIAVQRPHTYKYIILLFL